VSVSDPKPATVAVCSIRLPRAPATVVLNVITVSGAQLLLT
jgi:hypothetical protein